MGSKWIEVGTALICESMIAGVSEVHYDKYDEKWNFTVSVTAEQRFMSSVDISSKDEAYVTEAHTALKKVLIARN